MFHWQHNYFGVTLGFISTLNLVFMYSIAHWLPRAPCFSCLCFRYAYVVILTSKLDKKIAKRIRLVPVLCEIRERVGMYKRLWGWCKHHVFGLELLITRTLKHRTLALK